MANINRADKTKSKIKCHIVDADDKQYYWYSFTAENNKPNIDIINKMYGRIQKHFGSPKVVTFYANPAAGYSGEIIRKYINGARA